MEITQELLHELFEYRDGELYWKNSPTQSVKVGAKAGSLNNNGYIMLQINKKLYLLHRIIFLMFKGYLPKYVDHINNNPLDNHIENLRECSLSENQHNSIIRKDNISGVKGVGWNKNIKKWLVRIQINNKRKYLGYYDDLELAKLVAEEARLKYHGEFANHGKINEKVSA